MIIEEYDESLFIQRFENYKRIETPENQNGNFSYKGLRFLFEYLDDLHTEENPYRLDVIALCCEFSEYKNINEYLQDYSHEQGNFEDFIKREYLDLYKEFLVYKKESIKNGVNFAETIFNWLAFIKKNTDLINEFKEEIEKEITNKTILIKFGDNLYDGFIIQQY